jgi:hypothetical protein
MKRTLEPTEDQIQKSIIEWSNTHPILKDFLVHIPNQRQCTPPQGARFKKLGVRPGVSDLILPYPSKNYHGLWCEVKTKIGVLTQLQQVWLDRMKSAGYYTCIARSLEEFQKKIWGYLYDSN